MKTASAKAKGRRCAQEVKDLLLGYAHALQDGDILVTPSGQTGPDLILSPAAQAEYPWLIECKNQEAMNVWASLDQAESHRPGAQNSHTAMLFFKRNKSKLYVALEAVELMRMLRR